MCIISTDKVYMSMLGLGNWKTSNFATTWSTTAKQESRFRRKKGPTTKNIRIHHNLAYNNRATGLFFSRWGADNLREDLKIYNNTFYQNGWGIGMSGDPQYWLNGGCFIYSTNLKKIIITNNIFARNIPFEIGFSEKYGTVIPADKQIEISYNLIQDINVREWPFTFQPGLKRAFGQRKEATTKRATRNLPILHRAILRSNRTLRPSTLETHYSLIRAIHQATLALSRTEQHRTLSGGRIIFRQLLI
jgi:hypothetical protein